MNKNKNEKNAEPTTVVESKRSEEAYKRQAVEHWLRSGKNGTQIAKELGMSYPSLKEWKRRYGGDAAPQRADLEAENRALRAELARVREQRDVLKKRRASSRKCRDPLRVHRKANCYDNATMESFWSSFKRECADGIYPTRRDGTAAAFDYIETFYNRVRLHSAPGYQSPVDFENQLN